MKLLLPYGFSIESYLDFVSVLNAGNIKSDKLLFDIQWTIGLGWSL